MPCSGMQPTLYRMDVNAILRLADISVFDINFLDEQDKAIATRDEMSISLVSHFGGGGVPIPSGRAWSCMLTSNWNFRELRRHFIWIASHKCSRRSIVNPFERGRLKWLLSACKLVFLVLK